MRGMAIHVPRSRPPDEGATERRNTPNHEAFDGQQSGTRQKFRESISQYFDSCPLASDVLVAAVSCVRRCTLC